MDAIVQLRAKYIAWPNQLEALRISNSFYAKSGIPDVIGCIDGCHIPIAKPSANSDSYINRKGFYSMVLQGVCDDKRRFIDVSCGMTRSTVMYNKHNYLSCF